MEGFEIDEEELRSAAAALRSFASHPPARVRLVSPQEIQNIRNPHAMAMISSLLEKGQDNLQDLVTVILALGDGLEKVAVTYGLADVWGGR